MPAALSGLLTIAIVRRLMLELMAPTEHIERLLGEEVEVWVGRSNDEFGGWTPSEVLASPNGVATLKEWLQQRLELQGPSKE